MILNELLSSSLKWIIAISSTAGISYVLGLLLVPIFRPTIILYPWDKPDDYKQKQLEKTITVVLAGSFNPPHKGHLVMMQYLAERFGKLIVVVGKNPSKKYQVTPEERADLISRMLKDSSCNNATVEVVSGYIWKTVKPMGAKMFIRGIRSWEQDGIEERNLQILNTWGPIVFGPLWWPLPTIFLQAQPQYTNISSTKIRQLLLSSNNNSNTSNEKLSDLVPECIEKDVSRLYA